MTRMFNIFRDCFGCVWTEASIAVELTLLDVRIGLIVANDGTAGCTLETLGVKLDLTHARNDHHWSRHDRLTVATALTKAMVIILATEELAILLKVPTAQLISANAAPVDEQKVRNIAQKCN